MNRNGTNQDHPESKSPKKRRGELNDILLELSLWFKRTSASKCRTWAFEKGVDFITQNLEKLNFLRLLAPLLGKMRINVGSHQTSNYIVCRVHALKSILEYQSSNHHGIECPGYSWSTENNSKITTCIYIYIQHMSVYIHIAIYIITSQVITSYPEIAMHITFWAIFDLIF